MPGDTEYQRLGRVDLFGVSLQAAGGNARILRPDWDVDTHLGPFKIQAHYNSASGRWQWEHETRFDGTTFLSPSGAVYTVAGLSPGDVIPGSHWVLLGATALSTKGGLVYEFSSTGNLSRLRWRSGAIPRIEFTEETVGGQPRITRGSQCITETECATVFTVTSDLASGRVTAIADRTGRAALYDWDAEGRLITARSPLDVGAGRSGWRYRYDGDRLISLTSSDGVRTEIDYDPLMSGRARAVRRSAGNQFRQYTLEYGTLDGHNTTAIRDPSFLLASRVRFDWDDQHRTLARHEAGGEITRYEWGTASGLRVRRVTDPTGVTTEWRYADGSDDPKSLLTPSGNVLRFAYAPHGENRSRPERRPLAGLEDTLGAIFTAEYDDAGRHVASTNGTGERTRYSYLPDLNLLGWIEHPGALGTTTLSYRRTRNQPHPGHGHPVSIQESGEPAPRRYVYDAIGNLLAGRDVRSPVSPGMPGVVQRQFDANRNLAAVVLRSNETEVTTTPPPELKPTWSYDSEPATVEVSWRADGQIASISRPYGADTEFEYDDYGQLTERRDFSDGHWSATRYKYSARGLMIAVQRPNGMRREIDYRPNRTPSHQRFLRDGRIEGEVEWVSTAGRLSETIDSTRPAAQRVHYDAAGRVARVDYPNGEFTQVDYDLRSRVIRESFFFASGLPMTDLTYQYDLADRRTETRRSGELLARDVYVGGRIEREEFGNGLQRRYFTIADGAIASELIDGDGEHLAALVLRNETCANDPYGYIAACVRSTASGLAGTSPGDAISELVPRVQNEYPAEGQRLASAQIPNGGGMRWYSHDALGNLIREVRPQGDALVYETNPEHDRLVAVRRVTDGAVLHAYTYDEAGFVVTRDGEDWAFDAGGRIERIGARMAFRWDTTGQLIEQTVGGVSIETRFGGRAFAAPGQPPHRMSVGNIVIDLQTGRERYRHQDHRGNVLWVTDERGEMVAQYGYTPYGLHQTFGDDTDPVRFAGGVQLDEDLVLLESRVYDAAAARFLSPDPIYQVFNQFAYAQGNPIAFSDPSGLQTAPCAPEAASGVQLLTRQRAVATGAFGIAMLNLGIQIATVGLGTSLTILIVPIATVSLAGFAAYYTFDAPDCQGTCRGGRVVISDLPDCDLFKSSLPAPGGPVGVGCAPIHFHRVPNLRGLVLFLIELQLLLWPALLLLRRAMR
jgi:RHS repeat-associated protein